MNLHSVKREITPIPLMWVGGEYACPQCFSSYNSEAHHECARRFMPTSTPYYDYYYCVCGICRYQNISNGEIVRHYYEATNDRTTCPSCVNDNHPTVPTR